jgi:hypothetical protein
MLGKGAANFSGSSVTVLAVSPSYETDPRVDDYIGALLEWQQAICRRLRDVIHAAEPE